MGALAGAGVCAIAAGAQVRAAKASAACVESVREELVI
jgi:hypothetical protein